MAKQNSKQAEVVEKSMTPATVVRHIKLDPNAGKKPAKKEKPKIKQNNKWPLSRVMHLLDMPESSNRVSVATIQQGGKTVMLMSKIGVNAKGLLKVLTMVDGQPGGIVNLRKDAEVEVIPYKPENLPAVVENPNPMDLANKAVDAIFQAKEEAGEEPLVTMTELRALRGFTLHELMGAIFALGVLGFGGALLVALIRFLWLNA